MTEKARSKINIIAQCKKWAENAKASLEAAQQELIRCRAAKENLGKEQEDRAMAIQARIHAVQRTISDVLAQEGDAGSLERKKQELQAQLDDELRRQKAAGELDAAARALAKAEEAVAQAQAQVEEKQASLATAQYLRASHELKEANGAAEAQEFETLDEAITDYLLQIPLDVAVKDATVVDRVAIWSAADDEEPDLAEVLASAQAKYVLKALPPSLAWLKHFSDYAHLPLADFEPFIVGATVFNFPDAPKKPQTPSHSGGGFATSESARGRGFPAWSTGRPPIEKLPPKGPTRSEGTYFQHGICYIKSEDKLYCLDPRDFPCVKKLTERKQRPREQYRWGEPDWIEETRIVSDPKDLSILFADLVPALTQALATAVTDFAALQRARSPLAKRLRAEISSVASTKTEFSGEQRRLSQSEVLKEIGPYWEAFLDAPWEPSVSAHCALLKHLCSRNLETPHFYSFNTNGHFGLRVRTRDHDWLVAEIYCPPDALRPTKVSTSDVSYLLEKDSGVCFKRVKIGPCCIFIQSREK